MDNENEFDVNVIFVKTTNNIVMRGEKSSISPVQVSILSDNVSILVGQINAVLQKMPENVSGFYVDEIEINAEITAKGQLILLGTGGELSGMGGLKFLFKRK